MFRLERTGLRNGAAVALVALGLAAAPGLAAEIAVDCDTGETIAGALAKAATGDRIMVSGTCRESVYVTPAMEGLVLDGQGRATIEGPPADTVPKGPEAFAVFVRGKDIEIRGFTITGGFHGVHLSGPASAVIADNTIRDSGGAVHLDKASIGQIYGNTIEDNAVFGINLIENSYARIGFRTPPQPQLQPNIIRNNDGPGIIVGRWSSAWIMGNEIAANSGTGILVDRGSQADVAANDISGNGTNGITVTRNGGVAFHSAGTERPESGNSSAAPNGGLGVQCSLGGYVEGPLGTLAGRDGTVAAREGCIDGTKAEAPTSDHANAEQPAASLLKAGKP